MITNIERDLVLREYWVGYIQERSLEALGERFTLTSCAVWRIEKKYGNGVRSERNAQIKQLRAQYRSANRTQMPNFYNKAIAERNGVSVATVTRRRMAAIEAKALAIYDRRIAA